MWTEARCRELCVVSLEKLRLICEGRWQPGVKISRLLSVAMSGWGGGRQEEKVNEGHFSL